MHPPGGSPPKEDDRSAPEPGGSAPEPGGSAPEPGGSAPGPGGSAPGPGGSAPGPGGSAPGPDRVADVADLSVMFRREGRPIHALRGVDCHVRKGEILALVGESGSGKSVLGLSLLGLLPRRPAPAVKGRATVMGVDMLRSSDDQRRHVRKVHLGAVFQDPMTSLNPTMRIGAQVQEAAGSTEEALQLLRAVGVPSPEERLGSFPHELSGGLRQRVMIAMAIAGQPALVIADEPTTALDVTVQAQILDLIVSLRDRLGSSFVFITHDLAVARQVADRIVVLYGGRVAEQGPAEAVLRGPLHPYTTGLLLARVTLQSQREKLLPTLTGEPLDPSAELAGCPYSPRCPARSHECDDHLPELVPVDAARTVACVLLDKTGNPPALGQPCPPGQLDLPGQLELPDQPCPPQLVQPGAPAPGPRPLVLRVNDLEKAYRVRPTSGTVQRSRRHRGELLALRGVSLELDQGQALAVVGESGSGKSTLLRAIAGLVSPDAGTVEVAGERPQMVFQDAGASLTPWLSVGELLGERLARSGLSKAERRQRVIQTLAAVELPEAITRARPHQLSGGQRQRVAIARTIVVPPKVLLCDEPTSALDVSLAATVINLLGRLRAELGLALVFVTHDLAVARMVADRLAVMYLGRIVEEGPIELVCAAPGHPYTMSLMAAVPGAKRAAPLPGEPASFLNPPSGCSFHPRCFRATSTCPSAVPDLCVDDRQDAHHLVACVHWGLH
jgi:peptide/nickel transport system ATP-binding protein